MKLLDVNVWLAASWARHRHHEVAKKWLDQEEDELASCRVTQMALLRLITNPAITGRDALSRRQAWDVVDQLMGRFARSLSVRAGGVCAALEGALETGGSRLFVVDGRLLGRLAQATEAELVTLDSVFRTRYPAVRVIDLLQGSASQRVGALASGCMASAR